MEPFSISCMTCGARLKIRKSVAIGQILACPKCSSMNLIEQPATDSGASSPKGASPGNVSSHGKTGSRTKNRWRSEEPPTTSPRAAPPVAESAAASVFEEVNLLLNDSSETARGSTQLEDVADVAGQSLDGSFNDSPSPPPLPPRDSGDIRMAETDDPMVADVQSPLLPTDQWESQQAHGRRQFAMVFMAGLIGMGIAVAGAAWVLVRDNTESSVSSVESGSEPHDEVAASIGRDGELAGGERGTDTESPLEENTTVDATPSMDEVSGAVGDSATSDDAAEGGVATSSLAELPARQENQPASSPPAVEAPAPDAIPPQPAVDSRQVRDTFGELTAGFGGSLAGPSPGAAGEVPEVARVPRADVQVRPSVPRPVQPRIRRVNVAERLKDPIPQVSLPPVPLARFLRWVTKYSTIPITVDPLALQQTGSSMATVISFEGSELTVGTLLSRALAPHHLEYLVDEGQLVIVAAGVADQSLKERRYNVADLLGPNGEGLAPLVSLVEQMVAPSSWKRHGGLGTIRGEEQRLVVTQTINAHYEIVVFVEKLRVTRGLRIRSRYPVELFSATIHRKRAAAALEKPVDVQFLRPTSLRQIVENLADQAGVQLLVDWRSLAAAGWSDQVAISLELPRGPLEDALQRLLEPMDLTYRVIDVRTIQITTRKAELASFDLEAYAVGDLMARGWGEDRILRAIRMQFGSKRFTSQGGGALVVDMESETLFVRLPQSQQIVLDAALHSLRNT